MKVTIVKLGKHGESAAKALVENYEKRLSSICRFESIELKEGAKSQKSSTYHALTTKGDGNFVVALDEHGKELASKELATNLQGWIDNPSINNLIFVVGSPYGLEKAILDRADVLYSLSRATFPSDLAWILTHEQLYRAFTILNGSPYHHE